MSLDIQRLRHDFAILDQTVYGKPLIYFDNAATTQKPRQVTDRIIAYQKKENSNIHRGVHYLSNKATEAYENARATVQQFIHARSASEIVFTKGTTEAINLVAASFSQAFLRPGDEIILTEMEHHSNIVPWQLAAHRYDAMIKVIPIDEQGELDFNELKNLLNERTRIVAITHVSNVLGTINPIRRIIELAHQQNIPVLVDGAQGVPHLDVDVQAMDCDFYCFSSHKMYGPMGVGVLYAKSQWLKEMPPYQGGGEMIENVTFNKATFAEPPLKFEAGTPNVMGVLGLEAAIKYIGEIDIKKIHAHEFELLDYATVELLKIDGTRIYGTAENKASVIAFNLGKVHPYDAGTIYDKLGIALRTGHHCAQPIMDKFQVPGMVRASLALYNTKEEIDRFIEATKQVNRMLG